MRVIILNHPFMSCTILCKCSYRAAETIKLAFSHTQKRCKHRLPFMWGIKKF